jgi:phosphoribosylglycinamide formyltransferase-1
MLQLAVLISGRGSNMVKLAEAIETDQLDARIAIVISNQHCAGLAHAANLGIETKVIERRNFTTRQAHDAAIQDAITSSSADYVFLAGYMAILGAEFTKAFAGKLINIHPSLLPEFKGLDTHQRAIEAQARQHGATVHLVTAELDDGPIILQAELSILPDDDAGRLAKRVLQLEHHLYPFVLECLCEGHLTLAADQVNWHSPDLALQSLSADRRLIKALKWPKH